MSTHFKSLKKTLSKLPRDKEILDKLNDMENTFIYKRDTELIDDKKNIRDITLCDNSEQMIKSPIDTKYDLLSAIFYAINSVEYLLICNNTFFWDNLFSKMIIDLDEKNIYKSLNYKSFIRKKQLIELLSKHETNNYFVIRYLADFLNINIVITTEKILYCAKTAYDYNVGTIVLKLKADGIYTNNCIYKNTVYNELNQKYEVDFKNFKHIILGNITKYKLPDLVKLCQDYNISHGKSKKSELYDKLVHYFGIL